jgi:hypothetical protein
MSTEWCEVGAGASALQFSEATRILSFQAKRGISVWFKHGKENFLRAQRALE